MKDNEGKSSKPFFWGKKRQVGASVLMLFLVVVGSYFFFAGGESGQNETKANQQRVTEEAPEKEETSKKSLDLAFFFREICRFAIENPVRAFSMVFFLILIVSWVIYKIKTSPKISPETLSKRLFQKNDKKIWKAVNAFLAIICWPLQMFYVRPSTELSA